MPQQFIHELIQLDAKDDMAGLQELALKSPHGVVPILTAIQHLLGTARIKSSYVLSMMLHQSNLQHPFISLSLAAGGLLFNRPDLEAVGLQLLPEQMEALSEADRYPLYKANHALGFHLSNTVYGKPGNLHFMLRVIEILKAVDPQFRPLFDWNAPIPKLSREALVQKGRARARLIPCLVPPPGSPRPKRRVLVAEREVYAPKYPGTPGAAWPRLCVVGPALVETMRQYGWEAEMFPLYGPQETDWLNHLPGIIEKCRQMKPDILILEPDIMMQPEHKTHYIALLRQLRQEHPQMKLVADGHDSYGDDQETLLELAPLIDLMWMFVKPTLPVWSMPAFANKILLTPFVPNGHGSTERPLKPEMAFRMAIFAGNWSRLLWLTAAQRMNSPFDVHISNHRVDDGLSAIESHAQYMRKFEESTCCINLLMRSSATFTKTLVGRTFEVSSSGALLVQEAIPDMDYYFISGEHYLEFSSVAELVAISRFITEQREEAEEIRRCGYAFARARYSDEKLIAYLDHKLYYSDTAPQS